MRASGSAWWSVDPPWKTSFGTFYADSQGRGKRLWDMPRGEYMARVQRDSKGRFLECGWKWRDRHGSGRNPTLFRSERNLGNSPTVNPSAGPISSITNPGTPITYYSP